MSYLLTLVQAMFACCTGRGWEWYRAGVQQRVWAKEGCELTQWDVFMGAKPTTRRVVR